MATPTDGNEPYASKASGMTAPNPTPAVVDHGTGLDSSEALVDKDQATWKPSVGGVYPRVPALVSFFFYLLIFVGYTVAMARFDSFIRNKNVEDISCGIFRCQNMGIRDLEKQNCDDRNSLAEAMQCFSIFGGIFTAAFTFMYLLLGTGNTTKDVTPYLARAHITNFFCMVIAMTMMICFWTREYCGYKMKNDYGLQWAICMPVFCAFLDALHMIVLCVKCDAYLLKFGENLESCWYCCPGCEGTWQKTYETA